MLDICAMTATQLYALRDTRDGHTHAIVQLPMCPDIPEGEIIGLSEAIDYHTRTTSAEIEWKGDCNQREVRIEFRWGEKQTKHAGNPTSMAVLFSGRFQFQMEPVDKVEAENALMLGGVDYYRCIETLKMSGSSPFHGKCEYVGRMDPETAKIPSLKSLEEEPKTKRRPVRQLLGKTSETFAIYLPNGMTADTTLEEEEDPGTLLIDYDER